MCQYDGSTLSVGKNGKILQRNIGQHTLVSIYCVYLREIKRNQPGPNETVMAKTSLNGEFPQSYFCLVLEKEFRRCKQTGSVIAHTVIAEVGVMDRHV